MQLLLSPVLRHSIRALRAGVARKWIGGRRLQGVAPSWEMRPGPVLLQASRAIRRCIWIPPKSERLSLPTRDQHTEPGYPREGDRRKRRRAATSFSLCSHAPCNRLVQTRRLLNSSASAYRPAASLLHLSCSPSLSVHYGRAPEMKVDVTTTPAGRRREMDLCPPPLICANEVEREPHILIR